MARSKITSLDSLSFQDLNEDAELIPLMTPEDEEAMNKEELPEILPILPLRNTVLFPGVVIPITAGRDKSIELIKETNKENKIIGVVSQIDENVETILINFKELYEVIIHVYNNLNKDQYLLTRKCLKNVYEKVKGIIIKYNGF